jgi:hypothetical protein
MSAMAALVTRLRDRMMPWRLVRHWKTCQRPAAMTAQNSS